MIVCGMLDGYLSAFAQLRMKSGTVPTGKALLLLSVMDLIAQGAISRNFIELTRQLSDTFTSHQLPHFAAGHHIDMADPFVSLQEDGFWHLSPRAGNAPPPAASVTTVEQLRQVYFGARFSADLFPLLQMQTSRNKLRETLITTYFQQDMQYLL